jgi:hypothetical protein
MQATEFMETIPDMSTSVGGDRSPSSRVDVRLGVVGLAGGVPSARLLVLVFALFQFFGFGLIG